MDAAGSVADMFSDMIMELTNQCRFTDCKHDTEPGCAINASIEKRAISTKNMYSGAIIWIRLV